MPNYTVVTYQAPSGATVDLTPSQIERLNSAGVWPRDHQGQEYCSVSHDAITSNLVNYSMGLSTERVAHRSLRAAKKAAKTAVRAAGYGWTAIVDTAEGRHIRAFGSDAAWCEAFTV